MLAPNAKAVQDLPRWARIALAARSGYHLLETLVPNVADLDRQIQAARSAFDWAANLASEPMVYDDFSLNDILGALDRTNVDRCNKRRHLAYDSEKYQRIGGELWALQSQLEELTSEDRAGASEVRALLDAALLTLEAADRALNDSREEFITFGKSGLAYGPHLMQLGYYPEDEEPLSAEAAAKPGLLVARFGLASRLQQDYDMLIDASRRESWTPDTAVSREFFSPDSAIERQIIFVINDLCVKLCELVASSGRGLRSIEWRISNDRSTCRKAQCRPRHRRRHRSKPKEGRLF